MHALRLLFIFVATLTVLPNVHAEESLDALIDQAIAAEQKDNFASARAIYTRATAAYPDDAQAWAAFGEHLRFYVHDEPGATAAFNKAINAPKTDKQAVAFAWRGLGELAAKKGDEAEALRLMLKSVEVFPVADTHRSITHLFVMQRKWDAAILHARKAAELEPDDPIALLLYAAQLHRSGKIDDGAREARKALTIAGVGADGRHNGPVHCCVFYNAAGYYAVRGDNAGAVRMLDAFFKTPNHRHLTREQISGDPDFADLSTKSEFTALLDQYLPSSKQ